MIPAGIIPPALKRLADEGLGSGVMPEPF